MPDDQKRKKAIEKVRALRALAANNPSAEESKRATELAAKLMEKYKITEAELKPKPRFPQIEIPQADIDELLRSWAGNNPLKQVIGNFGVATARRYYQGLMNGKLPTWRDMMRAALRDAMELTVDESKKEKKK